MANKHDYHWTFGDQCHISFPGGGGPVVEPDHKFVSFEGCASVSDANGNLLFYTDGSKLYDTSTNLSPIASSLGGDRSSAHSAIIVPPAGGGSLYHIFAVLSLDKGSGPVTHTAVSVSGTGVAVALPPAPLSFGPLKAAEKLAAIPHSDCNKYWVVCLDPVGPEPVLHSILIDSDSRPASSDTHPYHWAPYFGYCMKFSPDGRLLAITAETSIDIFNFNRTTGAITPHSQIDNIVSSTPFGSAYGVEFSPDSRYLYFTGYKDGYINRHKIGVSSAPPTDFSFTEPIGSWPTPGPSPRDYCVGALQLAPNGKIYGTKVGRNTLFEIGDPNNLFAGSVLFKLIAIQAGGGPLTLNRPADLGLPTFTRIADNCREPGDGDRCAELAALTNATLAEQSSQAQNLMATCSGEPPPEMSCAPLEIPPVRPHVSIRWGDSQCDCIEGDDTEVMHLTVCNPYSNLTLSNLVVNQLLVVDAAGNPVPHLPSGDPSIQLVPLGPYCFDDIAPCSCVTREFVLRLRGAPGGPYRILVRGICFDARLHGDADACFQFDVCED